MLNGEVTSAGTAHIMVQRQTRRCEVHTFVCVHVICTQPILEAVKISQQHARATQGGVGKIFRECDCC